MIFYVLVTALISISAGAQLDCEALVSETRHTNEIMVNPAAGQDVVLIPIFSDVHGKIETLFKAVSILQNRLNVQFPAIFITGDLGWYPYPNQLSEQQKKTEIRSESDLGFSKYLTELTLSASNKLVGRSLHQKYFEDARDPLKLAGKFYFVRGNHEDHDLLKDREASKKSIIPVDPVQTFNYLPDGQTIFLKTSSGNKIRIAVFGGIHAQSRPGKVEGNPLMVFDQLALNRLMEETGATSEKLDVLLTHQGPDGTIGGHEEVRTLIEILKPRIHLHGHSDQWGEPTTIGSSTSQSVPKLSSPKNSNKEVEAMILVWNPKTNSLTLFTPNQLIAAGKRAGLN